MNWHIFPKESPAIGSLCLCKVSYDNKETYQVLFFGHHPSNPEIVGFWLYDLAATRHVKQFSVIEENYEYFN